jgi:hypothetical protein
MTTETRLRAAIAMSLLSLIILTFFFFQQQEELRKCKSQDSFIQGGDIEKEQLVNRIDSLNDELNVQHMINSELSNGWEILRETHPILADSIDNQTE